MHDIKFIRDNPEGFDKAMVRRKLGPQSGSILKMDEERRALLTRLQELQAERNEKSKAIGDIKKAGGDAQAAMSAVAAIKSEMESLEVDERTKGEALNQHLAGLPNILFETVPDGADEKSNVEVRKFGEIKVQKGPDHVEIGEKLGMMDFEAAAKMSGSRFVLLSGGLARLERALAQFMLDTHTQEHGYTEVSPPLLVRDNAVYGTNQLPKFAEDLFSTGYLSPQAMRKLATDVVDYVRSKDLLVKPYSNIRLPEEDLPSVKDDTFINALLENKDFQNKNRLWLIPTAEVSLTNIVAEEIVEESYLPRRYTAHTPCFRAEAGAAGKDTRGMLRQHQFYKVEMVSIVKPEDSEAEHERMTKCAEAILQKLGLAFRTVVLCSGDTGFGAKKTYDIEVWLPGQEAYREISSCSNCGDFQARRMNARYKTAEKKNEFVHTLNGSGVAVGRALIAVIENYWDGTGIVVPKVLRPYMGGLEKIVKHA